MSVLTQKNVGGNTVSSSMANLKATTTIVTGVPHLSEKLATPGLPNIIFRTQNASTDDRPSYAAVFYAAVRTASGEPDFIAIADIAIPAGVPFLYELAYPCIALRVQMFISAGEPDYSITYTLSAYGP